MAGVGIDRDTGRVLAGWAHVEQSIKVILETLLGSRVMRRDFGSNIASLIDAPLNDRVLLKTYSAIAEALTKWEPRYKLETVKVAEAGAAGAIIFELDGVYFPRGHLGDFMNSERKTASILIEG